MERKKTKVVFYAMNAVGDYNDSYQGHRPKEIIRWSKQCLKFKIIQSLFKL